jgi:hypothetical protein
MAELPFAKQPPDAKVLGSGANFRQFATSAAEFGAAVVMLETPVVTVQLALLVVKGVAKPPTTGELQ